MFEKKERKEKETRKDEMFSLIPEKYKIHQIQIHRNRLKSFEKKKGVKYFRQFQKSIEKFEKKERKERKG